MWMLWWFLRLQGGWWGHSRIEWHQLFLQFPKIKIKKYKREKNETNLNLKITSTKKEKPLEYQHLEFSHSQRSLIKHNTVERERERDDWFYAILWDEKVKNWPNDLHTPREASFVSKTRLNKLFSNLRSLAVRRKNLP